MQEKILKYAKKYLEEKVYDFQNDLDLLIYGKEATENIKKQISKLKAELREINIQMEQLQKTKQELMKEMVYGLPSRRMIEVVNFGAFKINDRIIIVKSRYTKDVDDSIISTHSFVTYSKKQDFHHDYSEIMRANVVFDESLLNARGREAMEKLKEIIG